MKNLGGRGPSWPAVRPRSVHRGLPRGDARLAGGLSVGRPSLARRAHPPGRGGRAGRGADHARTATGGAGSRSPAGRSPRSGPASRPAYAPLQTDGVILPGMLDLHGHPEFNVFAPWEPPKTYVNRYSWRGSKPYQELVRDPQNALIPKLPSGTQLRYAEIRALVGGVTAIQGASLRTQGSRESMVRNVDGLVFGEHRARAAIDLPSSLSPSTRGGPEMKKILDAIELGRRHGVLPAPRRGQAGQRALAEGVRQARLARRPDEGDGDDPRHRAVARPARPGGGRRCPAGLVTAVQPPAVRRDHPRRRRPRRRSADGPGRGLAPVGLAEPARRDEGGARRSSPYRDTRSPRATWSRW